MAMKGRSKVDFDWITADFEAVIPATGRSRQSRPGLWQIAEYQTQQFSGKLAVANPDSRPPEIRIALPLKETYDLFFGMQEEFCDRIKVKLASDRAFDRLCHSRHLAKSQGAFQEVFWRTATLDGKETLIIRQDPGLRVSLGFVAARRAKVGPEPLAKKDYLLHITDDGFPGNWGAPEDDEDAVWQVEPCARLGVDIISLGTNIAGMANYPTRHDSLRIPTSEMLKETFPASVYEIAWRNMADDARAGRNVPRRYFALAKENGMRTFAYARMAHLHCSPPYDAFRSEFFDAHPEFRCIDIDGVPVNRLSIAFPEVRLEYIKLFAECVELGADGINAVFVRGLPLVLYEEPVREAFRKRHGKEIIDLPENEPSAQAMRAEFVTAYMREQREAMQEAGRGRKIAIMAIVPATKDVCDFFGFDIARWVKEGLVDILCPYRWGVDASDVALEMDFFCAAVRDTRVQLLPFINAVSVKDPVDFLERAIALCKWPIDGLSVWDAILRGPGFYDAFRNLGSLDAMRETIERLKAGPRHHHVRTLNGVKNDKYHFGWAL